MSDNAKTVGTVISHNGVRDAIHVPIISVIAAERLAPGDWVTIDKDNAAFKADRNSAVAIIDPYLQWWANAGELVWAFLRPGSITTLTHHWTHREIADSPASIPVRELARARLEKFATDDLGVTLDKMLATIDLCSIGDEHRLVNGDYYGLDEYSGFWSDYVLYTGKPDPNQLEDFCGFFSCGGCP